MNKIKVIGIGIVFLLIVTTIPIVSSEKPSEEPEMQYDYVYKVSIIGRITDLQEQPWGTTFKVVRGFGRIVQTTNTYFLCGIFRCKGMNMYFSYDGDFKGILRQNFICGTYTLEQHYPPPQPIFPLDEMQIV